MDCRKSASMKFFPALTGCFAALSLTLVSADDVISKVMKECMKGDDSLCAKVGGGMATDDEINALAEMVHSLKGTEAPKGEQGDYAAKVEALIAAIDTIKGGDKSPEATATWKQAANCKSCHSEHKP